eukprot:GHVT01023378.1.p1 GENE.GHVT01023378.1~~GHVT01023378.1.p1  ORF type:complete len:785 (-),score=214.89 GHVT01023378.1:3392-5746(-)
MAGPSAGAAPAYCGGGASSSSGNFGSPSLGSPALPGVSFDAAPAVATPKSQAPVAPRVGGQTGRARNRTRERRRRVAAAAAAAATPSWPSEEIAEPSAGRKEAVQCAVDKVEGRPTEAPENFPLASDMQHYSLPPLPADLLPASAAVGAAGGAVSRRRRKTMRKAKLPPSDAKASDQAGVLGDQAGEVGSEATGDSLVALELPCASSTRGKGGGSSSSSKRRRGIGAVAESPCRGGVPAAKQARRTASPGKDELLKEGSARHAGLQPQRPARSVLPPGDATPAAAAIPGTVKSEAMAESANPVSISTLGHQSKVKSAAPAAGAAVSPPLELPLSPRRSTPSSSARRSRPSRKAAASSSLSSSVAPPSALSSSKRGDDGPSTALSSVPVSGEGTTPSSPLSSPSCSASSSSPVSCSGERFVCRECGTTTSCYWRHRTSDPMCNRCYMHQMKRANAAAAEAAGLSPSKRHRLRLVAPPPYAADSKNGTDTNDVPLHVQLLKINQRDEEAVAAFRETVLIHLFKDSNGTSIPTTAGVGATSNDQADNRAHPQKEHHQREDEDDQDGDRFKRHSHKSHIMPETNAQPTVIELASGGASNGGNTPTETDCSVEGLLPPLPISMAHARQEAAREKLHTATSSQAYLAPPSPDFTVSTPSAAATAASGDATGKAASTCSSGWRSRHRKTGAKSPCSRTKAHRDCDVQWPPPQELRRSNAEMPQLIGVPRNHFVYDLPENESAVDAAPRKNSNEDSHSGTPRPILYGAFATVEGDGVYSSTGTLSAMEGDKP